MAQHFRDQAPDEGQDVSESEGPLVNDLASIGQELQGDTPATVPSTDAVKGSSVVFGLHRKRQSRKSRRESRRRARGSRRRSRHHHHRHRHHRRTWPKVVAMLLVLLVTAVGVEVFLLYRSANEVLARAQEARSKVATLESALMEGDAERAQGAYAETASDLHALREQMGSPVWTIASAAPFVGHDVSNGRVLVDCACDLVDNAMGPLVENAAGLRLSDLVVNRRIDTNMLASLRGAVVEASPVVVRASQTLSSLKPGSIERVNNLIESLSGPLASASVVLDDADTLFLAVLDMLGNGGQTRNYVILAQTNSEIRAGGGFLGSVGTATVTDGNIELGNFSSVVEVKDLVYAKGGAQISADELEAFGDVLSTDAAGPTLTPNFVRAGQIAREQWQNAYGTRVDGVVAMDPIFLQHVLALTGGITAEDGTVVDGTNAAEEILKNVYWRYGFESNGNELEDEFFADVANRSFGKLLDSLGDFTPEQFSDLWSTILSSGEERRFQAWMSDETQESLMQEWGLAGELQSDVSRPELGLYANDNTWAKITWYLDIDADVSDPIANGDGTTSYEVTAHYRNTATEEEIAASPAYVYGGNPLKRSKSDMVETTYVMAPLGSTISNYEVHQDAPLSDDKKVADTHFTLYDRDCWRSRINILAGGDTTITFTLTLPAEATEPLVVRTDPLCHE